MRPGVLALTVIWFGGRSYALRMSANPLLSPKVGIGWPVFRSSAYNLLRYVTSTRSPVTTSPRWRNRLGAGFP